MVLRRRLYKGFVRVLMELWEEKVGSRLNERKDISTHKREEPLVVER